MSFECSVHTSFTDEDLKRLKDLRQEIMESPSDMDLKSVYVTNWLLDGPKLIARLEAAEAWAHLPTEANHQRWLKACGK